MYVKIRILSECLSIHIIEAIEYSGIIEPYFGVWSSVKESSRFIPIVDPQRSSLPLAVIQADQSRSQHYYNVHRCP